MASTNPKSRTRRRFLLGGVGLAGALIVGWGALPPRQRLHLSSPLPAVDGVIAMNGWIRIAADGTVLLAMPRSEMGQGVHTALPMLVAEELDVPLSVIRIEQAPIDKIFGNVAMLKDGLPFHPDESSLVKDGAQWFLSKAAREFGLMVTGGSTSVRDAWEPMRQAGATARAMLVAAAAAKWKVAASECRTDNGAVLHADGRRIEYGALAAEAATARPGSIRLKDPKEFRLIGKPQPRRDSATKTDGSAVFGLDVRPAGMVYAAVVMPPRLGARPQRVDANAVRGMPGVMDVVNFSVLGVHTPGVAVLARSWWQARQAANALPVVWNDGPYAQLSNTEIFRGFAQALESHEGTVYYRRGNIKVAEQAVRHIEAEYSAPYLAHAALEPINCTAQVKDGKVVLWLSTQVPSVAVDAAARIAGVRAQDVTMHETYVGGGFGRRLEIDMVSQTVAIAMRAGSVPVQMIWSREQDTRHDVYRPAALSRFRASLDANGKVIAFDNKSASGSITHQVVARTFNLIGGGPDKTTVEGAYDLPYGFDNQRIAHVLVDSPVPLGYWRSVGHSHNAFFKESFIDEIAHALGQDPVVYRRSLLQHQPRYLAVLDAALARAGQPRNGRAHGVALHQSFGAIVAQVAEVSVEGKRIRVHRVVCAIDCGVAVNPNIIAQQMEGGVVFGLSAALHGEITLEDGQVQQQNFHDYPILRMNEAPEVETIVMPSPHPPEGVGEPGVPPIAPAVANAVFQLTGQRLRSLPLRLA